MQTPSVAVERFIQSTQPLPSPPAVAMRVLQLAKDPNSSPSDIAKLIQADPSLAAQLLKTVNSAAFGPTAKVGSIERAVALMGMRSVVNLAVCFAVVKDFSRSPALGRLQQAIWRHSLTVAVAARTLAETLDPRNTDELFMGALLSDIGRVVFLTNDGERYRKLLDGNERGEEIAIAERNAYDFDHADLGHALLSEWNLPEQVCTTVRLHHRPEGVPDGSNAWLHASRIVYVGDRIAEALWFRPDAQLFFRAQAEAECYFGLEPEAFAEIVDEVANRAQEAAAAFQLEGPGAVTYSELLESANTQLRAIGVNLEEMVGELSRSRAESERVWRMLSRTNERLKSESIRDDVTGMYNGSFYDDAVGREMARTRAYGRAFSTILVGVDGLDRISQCLGMNESDRVVAVLGQLIRRSVRDVDLVARLSTDTFGVLLPETDAEGAEALAERLTRLVNETDLLGAFDDLGAAVNVGVCPVAFPGRILDRFELMAAARGALAKARERGHGAITVVQPTELKPPANPHAGTIATA